MNDMDLFALTINIVGPYVSCTGRLCIDFQYPNGSFYIFEVVGISDDEEYILE